MKAFNEPNGGPVRMRGWDAELQNFGHSERCDSVELNSDLRLWIKGIHPSQEALGPTRRSGSVSAGSDWQVQAVPVLEKKQRTSVEARSKMPRESLNNTAEVVGSKPGLGGTIPEDVQGRLGILETQKRELLEVNRKWDEQYQNMKKHYESKVMELRKKLAICDASAPEEEECERKRTDLEERLLQAEQNTETVLKRNSVVSAELLEAERQTRRLRLQNATLTRRGQQQESEIRRLNEVLREALLSTQDETRTQVEVLTHQLQIYEEDFLKERADRRRLKERNAELEGRVAALHAELELARSQVTGTSPAAPKPWRSARCGGCHGASRLAPAAGATVCTMSCSPVPPRQPPFAPCVPQTSPPQHQRHQSSHQRSAPSPDPPSPDLPGTPWTPHKSKGTTRATETTEH
ncbi:hypothetical protein MATL_G00032650 [Megalops atlanticus]|uniref:TNFAIP3 interacting protein 1 n=1 Tax=Megalops atlanticus TaxID=7932 RepID=A0A9D3QIU6_MEGAT|nr:hypothetical protein MATL_G00032650 [Megalops atlanticus]